MSGTAGSRPARHQQLHRISSELILSTLKGSAQWAMESKIDLDELWTKVVTPGGVTQAGMTIFDERKFLDTFVEGLRSATMRAREVSSEFADKED